MLLADDPSADTITINQNLLVITVVLHVSRNFIYFRMRSRGRHLHVTNLHSKSALSLVNQIWGNESVFCFSLFLYEGLNENL